MFRRKPRRVAVLGAGPAGLLSAYAATLKGYEVTIYTMPDTDLSARPGTPKKSDLYGCQYLHAPIPGLTEGEGAWVKYLLDGGSEAYREKVYGGGWRGSVSPDEYGPEEPHRAWDLRAAYDRLWDLFRSEMHPAILNGFNVMPLFEDQTTRVFATVPLNTLCRADGGHTFETQMVWAMGSAPGQELPYVAPDNTVQCNGYDAPRWYRAATVFGHSTLEWPQGVKPPVHGVARVAKPLRTDCVCFMPSDRWHRLGRYGQWRKGVLVHEAFSRATEILEAAR